MCVATYVNDMLACGKCDLNSILLTSVSIQLHHTEIESVLSDIATSTLGYQCVQESQVGMSAMDW